MASKKSKPPIIAVVGSSGAGKTTLLERLIPELRRRGFRVGTIKHRAQSFEMDRPGKDSWRLKNAGAAVSIVSSPYQIGMVMDVDHDHQPDELAPLLRNIDIILTEGYKRGQNPKIEVFRPEVHMVPLCKDDKHLLALVSDTQVDVEVPRFSTDDVEGLADFLINNFKLIPTISTQHLEAAS